MSSRPIKLLIEDILEAIEKIDRYIAGLDGDGFERDEKTKDAVVHNIVIVGEVASRLPEDFRMEYCDIPWRQIMGLRNRIVHAYFGVDHRILWTILQNDLPTFRTSIEKIREAQKEKEGRDG